MKKLLIVILLLFFSFIGKSQIYVGQTLSEVKESVTYKLGCTFNIRSLKGVKTLIATPLYGGSVIYSYQFNKKGICYKSGICLPYEQRTIFILQFLQGYRLDNSGDNSVWYNSEDRIKITEHIDDTGLFVTFVARKY